MRARQAVTRPPRLLRPRPTALGLAVPCRPDRYVRPLVQAHRLLLSSPPGIPAHLCGGAGGPMAVPVPRPSPAAGTEMLEDAWVGSALDNGPPP